MIRPLQEKDFDAVCKIVNDNWRSVYRGYVNPALLTAAGCAARTRQLKADYTARRLSEYVWEEQRQVLALLSFGDTADSDCAGAFEIWRIYVAASAQHTGIGRALLSFAEQQAAKLGYREILIWAFKENSRALAFYQEHAYCVQREAYLGAPYLATGVRLHKKLLKGDAPLLRLRS